MSTCTGLCPTCGTVGQWNFGRISISFPPTGGDYTWAELHTPLTCPSCKARFEVRVRADADDGQVDALVWSPMPTLENWRCYVLAIVRRFAADMLEVRVISFAATLEEAQAALHKAGGPRDGYERRAVLELSKDGYHELDGTPLHKSANDNIYYNYIS